MKAKTVATVKKAVKKSTKTSKISLTQKAKKEQRRTRVASEGRQNKETKAREVTGKAKAIQSLEVPLIRRREYLGDGKWSPFTNFAPEKWQNAQVDIPLQCGGTFTLYPGWFGVKEDRKELVKELELCGLFRVYQTQSTDQPRAQFLLHKQASEKFDAPNPGYDYHVAKMKAFPLDRVKGVQQMWDRALSTCQKKDFKIGANVIYYRGSRDKIHYHADDNQKESVIFAVVVKASRNGRCVSIRRKDKKPRKGDFEYKIFPRSGDAYLMDGLMQQHYAHSVLPKSTPNKEVNDAREKRVVVIFRDGMQRILTKDTGKPIYDLSPPPPLKAKPFGNCLEGLEEGRLYTRESMIQNGFHLTQRGVSGSMERGCEAISLSGEHKGNSDTFDILVYTAFLGCGARAMKVNIPDQIPIRVFRKQKCGKQVFHRYDGVYRITSYFGQEPITFVLRRNPVGDGCDKNRVASAVLSKLPLYSLETTKKLKATKKSHLLKNAPSPDAKR